MRDYDDIYLYRIAMRDWVTQRTSEASRSFSTSQMIAIVSEGDEARLLYDQGSRAPLPARMRNSGPTLSDRTLESATITASGTGGVAGVNPRSIHQGFTFAPASFRLREDMQREPDVFDDGIVINRNKNRMVDTKLFKKRHLSKEERDAYHAPASDWCESPRGEVCKNASTLDVTDILAKKIKK